MQKTPSQKSGRVLNTCYNMLVWKFPIYIYILIIYIIYIIDEYKYYIIYIYWLYIYHIYYIWIYVLLIYMNMYIIYILIYTYILSRFLIFYRVKLSRYFFYSNTYFDCLVAEFSVLELRCSASLYPINFKKTSHISRKWKVDWGCECLVRM